MAHANQPEGQTNDRYFSPREAAQRRFPAERIEASVEGAQRAIPAGLYVTPSRLIFASRQPDGSFEARAVEYGEIAEAYVQRSGSPGGYLASVDLTTDDVEIRVASWSEADARDVVERIRMRASERKPAPER